MIKYLPILEKPDKIFDLSYKELRTKYEEFVSLPDDEFRNRLPEAIHLACFICWVKEVPTQHCLGDYGVIHMLAHVLHIPNDVKGEWQELRENFKNTLKLA